MSTYRDISLDFTAHPVTGDLAMKSDVDSILQSIRNLVLSTAGEILWEPNMGGGVGRLLFEPNGAMLKIQLYDRITNTIAKFEPRVEVINLDIQRFENGNGIYIKLQFHILNNPEPITETLSIKRLR